MEKAVRSGANIIRLGDLIVRIGLSRSSIYARLDPRGRYYDSTFPQPVRLGGGGSASAAIGWLDSEIDAWIASRVGASRKESS